MMGNANQALENGSWRELLFTSSPVPMFIYDAQSYSFLDVNRSALEQYGYTRSEFLKMSVPDLYPSSDTPMALKALAVTCGATWSHSGTWRQLRKNRTEIFVQILCYQSFKQRNTVIAYAPNMTALHETQHELTKAQEVARLGSWVMDLPSKEVRWSDQTFRNLGLVPRSLVPTLELFKSLIHPADREEVQEKMNFSLAPQELSPQSAFECDHRVIWSDGSTHVMRERGVVLFGDDNRPRQFLGTILNITEQRDAEEKIEHLAYYDEVTELPNRVFLRKVLDNSFSPSSILRPTALVIVDLDRLKDINYTFGPTNGDQVLKDCGARIRQVIDPSNTVARIGNVQFAIVLMDASAYDVPSTIQRILKVFEIPCHTQGTMFELDLKFGVALAPGHGTDTDTILRKADVALRQSKQLGQTYTIYHPSRDPYKPERIALLAEFRRAIYHGELQLYCQPKADMKSRQIIGAEALVRWQHPQFGMISPNTFIPLIEQTQLIHLLTRFMLQAAIRQSYDWHRQGIDIPLAVNLSVRNLMEPDLAANLENLLLTWGADPKWLGLEITESSLMTDPLMAISALDRLSNMGFRLFIDDFGTGYSSLSYLMKLPVNTIKIDHGFTMNMTNDKGAAAIVKSTVELAHNLGMDVVAEGTSCQEVWDTLLSFSCDEAQGYFISPPLPANDFLAWLSKSGYGYSADVNVRT